MKLIPKCNSTGATKRRASWGARSAGRSGNYDGAVGDGVEDVTRGRRLTPPMPSFYVFFRCGLTFAI